jgi:DnaJ-class molecular chaperone
MPNRKDYYATLGVDKKADAEEIKRAYRKLARKWHPDVNPNDPQAEDRFKEIAEAYHVLGDADRRRQYDSVGPDAFAQQVDMSDFADQFGSFFRGGYAGGAGGGYGTRGDFSMFEEILGGLGGFGGRGPAPPQQGRSVRIPVQLSFEESVRGGERTVGYRQDGGTLRTRVRIPAGIKPGATIKVRGKGEDSRSGGPPGDLLLDVSVAPHAHLSRRGEDLLVTVPVTVYDAILGADVSVPTLDGDSTIRMPAGTRSGQVFRLRGRGVPAENGAGDLLATVKVQTPRDVDPELEELMRKFRSESPYDPE